MRLLTCFWAARCPQWSWRARDWQPQRVLGIVSIKKSTRHLDAQTGSLCHRASTSVPFGTNTIVPADGVAQPDAQVTADDCWLHRTNSRHEKLCLSSKCETASQQLWGSEGCHYHVHISSDSSDDTSGHPCCHYPNHWSSAAKRQLWLRCRAGPTAQMTQCLWLLLYSNVRVEATAKQHIFYFFEKRPCVCCSKLLIHCHCPTEFVGSYFPLACELYKNTAPDAGKVQRAESFSETTETRRERLPFRATRLRDWLKEYKNSS